VQFANYVDFRNKVQVLLDGDDISTSDLSTDVLDLVIGAGEVRIYRDLRSSVQDTALSLTVTGGAAAVPADFLELRGAPYVFGCGVASYVPWEALTDLTQRAARNASGPIRYSFQGDSMIFYPTVPDSTVVTGQYYKRFADISTGLNALFNRHPDLFIYAALSSSAPFLGEMTRLPIWEQTYTGLVESANEQERRRVTRGSKLATRLG
jgi:hypothetical protein